MNVEQWKDRRISLIQEFLENHRYTLIIFPKQQYQMLSAGTGTQTSENCSHDASRNVCIGFVCIIPHIKCFDVMIGLMVLRVIFLATYILYGHFLATNILYSLYVNTIYIYIYTATIYETWQLIYKYMCQWYSLRTILMMASSRLQKAPAIADYKLLLYWYQVNGVCVAVFFAPLKHCQVVIAI